MAKWEYYRTSEGSRVVAKEVLDLEMSATALVAWDRILTLIRKGEATQGVHFKPLTGTKNKGLYEVTLHRDGTWYRMIYSHESASDPVILAVRAFRKKSNSTKPEDLKVARRRRDDWRGRQA